MKKIGLLSLLLLLLLVGCEDDITKISTISEVIRIEFSKCTACGDCTSVFSCPEDAIKTDEEHNYKNYIDTDLCTRCGKCINDFDCPDGAFTKSEDTIAPGEIEDFSAISENPGELVISFRAPGDDANQGELFDYKFSIVDAENNVLFDALPTLPTTAGELEEFTFNNLPEGETVSMSLYGYDEVGNQSAKIEQNISITAEEVDEIAPATISDLVATAQGEDIVLTWTAPGDDDFTGTIAGYDIRYSETEISADNFDSATQIEFTEPPVSGTEEQTFTISNLTINTTYYFAVKANDEAMNSSAISNVVSASIDVDNIAPAAITNLSATTVTNTTITLEWTATGDNGTTGTATSYDIRYSETEITTDNFDSATEYANAPTPQEAGNLETIMIENLAEGTTYYFAIKVADEIPNISDLSNVLTATTESGEDVIPPATISSFYVVEGTSNGSSVQLRWTAPGDDDQTGTVARYEIRRSNDPITDANWNSAMLVSDDVTPVAAGTQQNETITGLNQAETYYFAIKAWDENDNENSVSNSPGARIVYQIDEEECADCNLCSNLCPEGAVYQVAGAKAIDPDICTACGSCDCNHGALYLGVVAYDNPRQQPQKSFFSKLLNR